VKRGPELEPLLGRHGIRMRREVLADPRRGLRMRRRHPAALGELRVTASELRATLVDLRRLIAPV
jgi:hypothetical protein